MSGPAPAVAAARRAVRDALADLTAGDLVLVACSGGPDSLALAAATAFVAPRAGLRAGAVVVDHDLQPGSDEVAADAAAACRGLGLAPAEVVRVGVGTRGGPEGAARDARYAALDAAADRLGAAAVLLGHTLDDQAETVLLGLARGSGARSLAGMPARRGRLRRPLLGMRREDTLAVCAALALTPWHDPTNTPPGARPPVGQASGTATDDDPLAPGTGPGAVVPLRSVVRDRVLPVLDDVLGPGVAPALARTADALREDADALDALAADLLTDARLAATAPAEPGPRATATAPAEPGPRAAATAPAEPGPPAAVDHTGPDRPDHRLDVAVLAAALPALRGRALRAAAVAAGAPAGSVHRTHVVALDALVTQWHGQGPVHLPGGVVGLRACGRLTFHTTPHD